MLRQVSQVSANAAKRTAAKCAAVAVPIVAAAYTMNATSQSDALPMSPPLSPKRKLLINKNQPVTAIDGFADCRPNPEEWTRIDGAVRNSPEFKHFIKNNVVHDTLVGEGMLHRMEIYQKKHEGGDNVTPEIMCLVHFGERLNGHPTVVHGGIVSTIFDNCFGWVFIASKLNPGFTANLNVNFRKPVMAGTTVIVKAKLTETTDRKRFLSATMTNSAGDALLAEATSLFILPKGVNAAKL